MTTAVKTLEAEESCLEFTPCSSAAAGSRSNGNVIVAHPGGGQMRSFEAAVGLQDAGLLQRYMTGFYFRPESLWGFRLGQWAQAHHERLQRQLLGRIHPDLARERVQSFPLADLVYLGLSQVPFLRGVARRLVPWRNQRFCEHVAAALVRQRPAAVLCYDSCALEAFRQAESLGIFRILDQCTAHIKTGMRLFGEEAALHPEFAEGLPLRVPTGWVERCCQELELADAVLVSSAYGKQTLIENGVPERKIFVIPYAAEIDRFRPRRGVPNGCFRVLFVGQVSQRKGIKYLLEAFRQLALPNAELVLIGGLGGSGKALEGYRGVFTHIPSVPYPDLHHYFQTGSIFVLPSLHDSGVLAIHEALASGLPVIATPNCGSVVRDGVEGFIVPIRNIAALKEKILLLYEHPELREAMARQARKRAEEYTWANYRRQVSGLLLQLLRVHRYTRG